MKSLLAVVLLATAPALALRADTPPVPATASTSPSTADADRAWKAVVEVSRTQPPEPLETLSPQERVQWMDANAAKVLAAFEGFYAAYPNDPRRWLAVFNMRRCTPSFIKTFGPEFAEKGLADATFDEAARAAFEKKLAGYEAALRAATDVPPVTREAFFAQNVSRAVTALREARANRQPLDWTAAHAALTEFLAAYPRSTMATQLVMGYMTLLESTDADRALTEWRALAASPEAALRRLAEQRLRDLEKKPQG